MMRRAHRFVLLTMTVLGLFALAGSASAGSRAAASFPWTAGMLTHAQVEGVLAHGQSLRLTSKFAEKTEVKLFVYGRALERGGLRSVAGGPNAKVYISPGMHVIFDRPGTQTVTLHVSSAYRDELLRAGNITEGYFYAGYQLIHSGK